MGDKRPRCDNPMPASAGSGPWREWHRGHGCDLDPGTPTAADDTKRPKLKVPSLVKQRRRMEAQRLLAAEDAVGGTDDTEGVREMKKADAIMDARVAEYGGMHMSERRGPTERAHRTEDNMGDKTRGLYGRFNVRRMDGSSEPGGKHEGCFYYVLDVDHDPHAVAALGAYADSCEADYPLLAADLRLLLENKP